MAACSIAGHPGSYGLGIRAAFYIQWFAMIIASWLLEYDALNLRFLNGLTVAATSIGLAVNLDSLQPVEIYVVLLLVCATLYFLVPIHIWRLVTCCRPWWDTERWNRASMGWFFRVLTGMMFGALLGLQVWFWCTSVRERLSSANSTCQQYGFLFGQVRLDNESFVTANIITHFTILFVGTWVFLDSIGLFDECRWRRKRNKMRWSTTRSRIRSLQQLRTVSDISVATILITAVELVIYWNQISNVNDLNSAAQLIPPIISGAYLIRSIHLWVWQPPQEIYYPYYTSNDDGNGVRVVSGDGGGGSPVRRNVVYIDTSAGWPGHRPRPKRHRRRSSHLPPNMEGGGATGDYAYTYTEPHRWFYQHQEAFSEPVFDCVTPQAPRATMPAYGGGW